MPAFFVSGADRMDATSVRMWELAAPLAQEQGMEIVDIEFRPKAVGRPRIASVS